MNITLQTPGKKRIAAYCRVSTDRNNQEDSFENQKQFFLNEAERHPDWELAGIYADQAKTGRQIKGRTDFQRMMRHAEAHQFDYVITKSISRFSRSTSDTLRSLEKLHRLGIGAYFIEQGYDTEAPGSQIILTMLAAIAEFESRNIAESICVTMDEMNKRGTPTRKCCYGYEKNEKNGKEWVIVPGEGIRVKLGFLMAANGYSFKEIRDRLNQFEEMDRSGREWDYGMVRRLLLNEAYIGDLLLNKSTVVQMEDHSKAQVFNDGIKDQYYIDCHHDPLVGKALWEGIKDMFERKELAGQENFHGIRKVQNLARRDRLLDEVRKYLPKEPSALMKKWEDDNG